MKILAINATYRPRKTTTQLTLIAMEGAASLGADTEMVMLRDCKIDYCLNCLTCYKDKTSELGPCSLHDDIDGILAAPPCTDFTSAGAQYWAQKDKDGGPHEGQK